jgi:hypothetical protein
MNKPIATLTGRLWSAGKIVTPDNGKPFVDITVKMAPRTWNGKTYFQKVYVRSYNQASVAMLPQLTADRIVTVTGEADAVPESGKDGKAYANIRVTGTITLFEGEAPTTYTGTAEAAPAPAAAPAKPNPNDLDADVF